MRKSQHLSSRQIAEAIRLRNWCEVEARPKHRPGVKAFSRLIEAEKERQQHNQQQENN